MTQEAHTPEPWEWDAGDIPPDGPATFADIYKIDADGECTIIAGFNDCIPEGRANARRIVACVNALAGIPIEAIESGVVAELVEAAWDAEGAVQPAIAQ